MFYTSISIPNSGQTINYQDNIITLGSCFSNNIGSKLKNAYFNIHTNPFGVLYNPVSIQNAIELLTSTSHFDKQDIFLHHSLWHSFSHDSSFSDVDKDECLQNLNKRLDEARTFFSHSSWVIITFGTAWVFEYKNTRKVVSNCHKLPAEQFVRKRLTAQEISEAYIALLAQLKKLNPDLKVIFTVSPIRHWKDGAHENNVSKSILLLAVDEIVNSSPDTYYFPAYEIQLDELRDYRYYASDMLHPSDVAVNYIWERFAETYFDAETLKLKKRLEHLSADLAHRPLFPESEEYTLFLSTIEKRKQSIIADYPFLSDRL